MLSAGRKPPQQQRDHNLPSPPQFQPHGVPMQLLPAPPTMQPTEPRKAPRSIITAADMPHVVQVIQYHFPVTIMLHRLPSHSWRQPSVKPLARLRVNHVCRWSYYILCDIVSSRVVRTLQTDRRALRRQEASPLGERRMRACHA